MYTRQFLSYTGEQHVETERTAPRRFGRRPPDLSTRSGAVERALSDGMKDPAEIAAWARNYKVALTVEEVRRIIAELSK